MCSTSLKTHCFLDEILLQENCSHLPHHNMLLSLDVHQFHQVYSVFNKLIRSLTLRESIKKYPIGPAAVHSDNKKH